MSNEEKQELQMKEEKKAFIHEQIAPKRRSAMMHGIGLIVKISLLGILFGIVGSFTFCMFYSEFKTLFHTENETKVVLETSRPETEEVKESVEKEPEAEEPATEEPDVQEYVDKKDVPIKIDEEILQSAYQKMREIGRTFESTIVTVSGVQTGVDWFDNPAQRKDATSGVCIADTLRHFYILTGHKEIADVNQIQVTLRDGKTIDAELVGKDEETNIAVISIKKEDLEENSERELHVAVLGDSYYAQKGTPIIALGNPNGSMYSMQYGMITGEAKEQYITDAMLELYTTDMPVNKKGQGVAIDLEGRILGIITHQFDNDMESDGCVIIGINRVKSMIEKIINGSDRAYFGVIATNIPEEHMESLAVEHGIFVTEVVNGSPALEAGIQIGDIITDIDQTEISSISNFIGALAAYSPKEEMRVKVLRMAKNEMKEKELKLVVGKR